MAASLTKTAGEIEKLFRKLAAPGEPKKTYWQVISEQAEEEGVWDEELLNSAKEQIGIHLNKFNNEKLFDLWEQSEAAAENFAERSGLKADSVKSDLQEELLNLVLDKLDSNSHAATNYYEGESYYIDETSGKDGEDEDKFEADIKDIDLNTDDLFDDDDDYFDDDDRF